jgi:erythronate-4-phosphate dehydrogenase
MAGAYTLNWPSMKTVVAETVMLGREAFGTLGEVEVIPDREIGSKHLVDADALIIRSKTKVTPELLHGSAVRFVGTATAGFEHIDLQALEKSNIAWTAAPGCNAESVAEYITAALLQLPVELEGKTIGIIGVGQVGTRVARCAEALGLKILLNDPPREAREIPSIGKNQSVDPDPAGRSPKNRQCRFQGLETLLATSDIVTLHVPLTPKHEPWPTVNMANAHFFEQMKPGAVFINASRGQVVDSDALLQAKQSGTISHLILDVWNPEPKIRPDVLTVADIATPHIAGHSLEGKLNGTIQVYNEACRFFEIGPNWNPDEFLPNPDLPSLEINSHGRSDRDVLAEAVQTAYNIKADQLTEKNIPNFDKLRANYRIRREFKNTTVRISENRPALLHKLKQLGFSGS